MLLPFLFREGGRGRIPALTFEMIARDLSILCSRVPRTKEEEDDNDDDYDEGTKKIEPKDDLHRTRQIRKHRHMRF